MKKILIVLLFTISNFVYAIKDLSTLKTLKFVAEEKQLLNGKEKVLRYIVDIKFPNKIRKEIIYPEMNKGELYIYDGIKKIVYLPFFNEYQEQEIDGEENRVIKTINKLREIEKDLQLKKQYESQDLKSLYIDQEKKIKIEIKEYLEKDNYLLPKCMDIKDEDVFLGSVNIDKIEINPKLEDSIFITKTGEK